MKLMKYSWLAALPMVFIACQDDMLMEKHQQQGVYTLTATMNKESAESRAQIVLNGTSTTKETFHWNEGDKFSLFELDGNGGWLEHKFNISESYNEQEPASSADFSTSLSLTQGREFVAFYPACEEGESGKVQMTIDMTLPDNSKESWTEYFQNNMFMKAQGVVGTSSADTKVNFIQLCGIIRITYKNTSKVDRTLGAIKVDGLWSIGGYCPLDNVNTFVPNVTQKGNAYGITFENGATVKAGSSEDFYILFLYNAVEGDSQPMSTVSVSDMNHNVILKTPMYSESLPVFQAGKCYWLNVTDNGNELLWSKGQQSGGEVLDEVSVDVSTYAELKQALTTKVNKQLTVNIIKDIALEGPLSITSRTNFEMCGNTLSLADNYTSRESIAVFEVLAPASFSYGTLQGKDGVKLHDYYFNMYGTHVDLTFRGVSLNTGSSISNAVFMDDDRISMSEIGVMGEQRSSSISTSGNAIHYVANGVNPKYYSYINGNITGDVYIKTDYSELNAMMYFQNGVMNGDLVCEIPEALNLADYIRYSWENVVMGDAYKNSWTKAGRYVENKSYMVSTFAELKAAIEEKQLADEAANINLTASFELTEPLVITKPVYIFGMDNTLTVSESFAWDSNKAVFINGGAKGEFGIVDTTLKGCDATHEDKYLVISTGKRFYLTNATLVGSGVANAVYVHDSKFNVFEATSITASGYAMNFCSNTTYVQPRIECTGTITGNVGFLANYKNDTYPNVIILHSGTINGDFLPAGTYASDVKVAFEGATANGANWADADINK